MKYLLSTTMLIFLAFGISAQSIQWANKVIAFSTEFIYNAKPGQYVADQALGVPNVLPSSGETPTAWTPSTKENPEGEFIELGFEKAKPIQQVFINENFNAGAINKVSLRDTEGKLHIVYENNTPKILPEGRLLRVTFEKTNYSVASIKIQLKTDAVEGYNQIDAVGIANDNTPYEVKVNTPTEAMEISNPVPLSDEINSNTDELLPIITADGSTMYFTREKHPENFVPAKQDIWFSAIDKDGNFSKATHMGEPINNKMNNAMISITPDGQTTLLINIYNKDGSASKGVSISKRTENGWSFPEPVIIEDFYNDSKYGEYFLSNSGKIMIMTLQRKESMGGKDLYVSFKDEQGTWSRPETMGSVVNTAADEATPFLASDERTLYFSTSGFPGYGNNDIFVSRRLGDTWQDWSKPENLGPIINTPKFDAYLSLPASGDYLYYVSSKNKENGTDIYRSKLPEPLRPQPVVLVKGKVSNRKTGEPIATGVTYTSLTSGKTIGSAYSDSETGQYSVVMTAGDFYGFSASKKGFLPVSENLDLKNLKDYQEIEQDLLLVPIEKDATIIINNLYFDTGKAELRSESSVELRQLLKILQENPKVKVEIAGHTDNVGSNESNQVLSRNRAKSVVGFLENEGIEQGRLISKGYGETQPAFQNDSDENRQKNRRVEFKIVSVE